MRTEGPRAKISEGGREESTSGLSRPSQVLLVSPGGNWSTGERPSCLLSTMLSRKSSGDSRMHALSPLPGDIIPSLLSSDVMKSLAPPWSVTSGCLEPSPATVIFINRPANAHRHARRNTGSRRELHTNLCTQHSQAFVTQRGATAEARGIKSGQSTAVPWP